MVHGLDDVGTAREAASTEDAAGPFGRILAVVNTYVVVVSSVALVAAAFVLTYSVVTRYFLHLSTDWQDEVSVFLIVGAVFMSAGAVKRAVATLESRRSWACYRRVPTECDQSLWTS